MVSATRAQPEKIVIKTRIEDIRRRDLTEAAYQVFLQQGLAGTTMARIGERAGMSHGIVNYYFKGKTDILSAVIRKSMFVIFAETAKRLKVAKTPRERLMAVVEANFTSEPFTEETARSWISFYAHLGQHPELDRVQAAFDNRLHSNLRHGLRGLVEDERVDLVATSLLGLIDGMWVRKTTHDNRMTREKALAVIHDYIDNELAKAEARRASR